MGLLIDSSVLVAAERGKLDLEGKLAEHGDEPVAISAITASELLHGVHRAKTPHQRTRREGFVERLLSSLPVVGIDLVVARVHASAWAGLVARGEAVGAHDLLIGATALALGFRVVTRDLRSFPKILGLELVHW